MFSILFKMISLTIVFALSFAAVATSFSVGSFDYPKRFDQWEGRLVGGYIAAEGQFPYQVSLQSNANAHFCGGFIINNRWVGSAAHCTINRTPDNTRVRVGSNDRTAGGTLFQASLIINHPDYDAISLENDVCTVQTSETIVFTTVVQPIALASVYHGVVQSTVSGWGHTSHPGGTVPVALQYFHTPTLTNTDCTSRHTGDNAHRIFNSSICAYSRAGQGACFGDSGGPLTSEGTVIGIVSWGVACAVGSPDVYARVSSFREWFLLNS